MVRKYEIRKGTGGEGMYRGGDGVVREIEARMDLRFSILSERRVYSPYGMEGGGDRSVGRNFWIRRVRGDDGEWREQRISLGGKAVVDVKGDRLQINTPGESCILRKLKRELEILTFPLLGGSGWGRPLVNGLKSDSRPRPTF